MANDEIKNHSDEEEKSFSRRNFLKMSGMATGSLVAGTYLGTLFKDEESVETQSTDEGTASEESSGEEAAEPEDHTRALKFFHLQDQFDTIQAAAERIFPSDDNGPGAAELGVAFFIDHELAGGYGLNSKEYRKGPFKPDSATPFQGPQYAMNRREVFLEGIRALDNEAKNNDVDFFHELEDDQQDKILEAMEAGDVDMVGIPSSYFFEQLRLATMSGTYADPLYRGNKDMAGWEMKGFPGAYMTYKEEIESEDFIEKDPQAMSSHLDH
jgi:gluconate 2-dehydrogenase gamma chain